MPNTKQNNEIEHINKEINIRNIVRNIFQNKIKQIKKNANLRQNTLTHVKKEKDYLKKD